MFQYSLGCRGLHWPAAENSAKALEISSSALAEFYFDKRLKEISPLFLRGAPGGAGSLWQRAFPASGR
jgi:hypothetical protein